MSKFDLMLGLPMPEPEKPKKTRKRKAKERDYSDAYDDEEFQARRDARRSARDEARRAQILAAGQAEANRRAMAARRREIRADRRQSRESRLQQRAQALINLAAQVEEMGIGQEAPRRRSRRTMRPSRRPDWTIMLPNWIAARGVVTVEVALYPVIDAYHRVLDRVHVTFSEPVVLVEGAMVVLHLRNRRRVTFTIDNVQRGGVVYLNRMD